MNDHHKITLHSEPSILTTSLTCGVIHFRLKTNSIQSIKHSCLIGSYSPNYLQITSKLPARSVSAFLTTLMVLVFTQLSEVSSVFWWLAALGPKVATACTVLLGPKVATACTVLLGPKVATACTVLLGMQSLLLYKQPV